MILWESFDYYGSNYSLEHLHPFSFDLIVPAKGSDPDRCYRINVQFSLHCFTRSPAKGESIPAELAYSDSRETRIFDFVRYSRSKLLREIVYTLADRACFHDTHGNFYVFEIIQSDEVIEYYSIFFTLSKAGKKSGLNLFISSAHSRAERPYAHRVKPIRFRILVHNVWAKKAIKPAQ